MLKTEKRMRARDFEQNKMQDGKARKQKTNKARRRRRSRRREKSTTKEEDQGGFWVFLFFLFLGQPTTRPVYRIPNLMLRETPPPAPSTPQPPAPKKHPQY